MRGYDWVGSGFSDPFDGCGRCSLVLSSLELFGFGFGSPKAM